MGAGVRKARGVETVAVFSDVHFPHVHWPTWRCAVQWIEYARPDRLILGGDIFDLGNLGRFEPDASRDSNLLPELRAGVAELNKAIACAGATIYVMGNHEDRWIRSLVAAYPRQFYGLPGLSFPEQLYAHGLDERCTFVEERPGWQGVPIGHAHYRHGNHDFKGGGPNHAAAKLQHDDGGSAACGHVHRAQTWVIGRPGRRTEFGQTGGCMEAQPKWGPRARWCRGWQWFEVDAEAGFAHPSLIICEQGRLAWGGQVFDGNQSAQSVGAARAGRGRQRRDYVHHDGRSLSQLAEATGIPYRTLVHRVAKGWHGDALLEPVDAARSARRRAYLAAQKQTPPA
jgi:hypothetical protein